MPLAITIRKLGRKKKGLLPTGPGNYTAHLGPHSKVTGREICESTARDLAFIGVEDEALGFLWLTFYW